MGRTVGKKEPDHRRQNTHNNGQHNGVAKSLVCFPHRKNIFIRLETVIACRIHKTLLHDFQQGPHHKNKKHGNHRNRDCRNDRITECIPRNLQLINCIRFKFIHFLTLSVPYRERQQALPPLSIPGTRFYVLIIYVPCELVYYISPSIPISEAQDVYSCIYKIQEP